MKLEAKRQELKDSRHYFGYGQTPANLAVNIKLGKWNVMDKAWDIALDKHMSQELWDFYLTPMIDNFKADTGYEVYVGGRSGGWLYLDGFKYFDYEIDELEADEVIEAHNALKKLEELAKDMFAELEYIAKNAEIVEKTYTTKHSYKAFELA